MPGAVIGGKLPTDPATVATMKRVTENLPLLVGEHHFDHEREMYRMICELFTTGLNHDEDLATVYDTNKWPYLNGYMPDVTIALPGTIEPDLLSVCVIVDLKLRNKKPKTKLGTDDDFGQIFDYLLAVQEAQPGRRTYVALLSDLDRNYIVTISPPGCGPPLIQYAADTIFGALAYIHDVALKSVSHLPPLTGFSLDRMRRRLGNPRHSAVGEFLIPNTTTGAVMAVKRTPKKTRETFFLKLIAAEPPKFLPLLVHNVDDIEFGITPVGTPLLPGMIAAPQQTRRILTDVIDAVDWLHKHRIIHRDIRCENIVLNGFRAVLIDFDASYYLEWSSPTAYHGGYLCIPPKHLATVLVHGMDHPYSPSTADDCFAVVLLAHCLLFPHTFADLRTHRIGIPGSHESQRMSEFWRDLEDTRIWRRFKRLAEAGVVKDLVEVTEIFY